MERLDVEIPVSVGDTLYRTNSKCKIEQGVVTNIDVNANYYRIDKLQKRLQAGSNILYIMGIYS